MSKRFTSEQQAAIELRRSSVGLAAGAGSGKTTVLTTRMLRDLDITHGPEGILRLVAITFTDRAAREMRERLREKCYEELRNAPREHLEDWQRVINLVDQARISTIHSFCQGILRTYALEFGIDPQFQILEESIAQSTLRQTIHDELIQLLEQRDAALMELLQFYELQKLQQILAAFVEQRFRLNLADWADVSEAQYVEQLKQHFYGVFIPDVLREITESHSAQFILEFLKNHETANARMKERREKIFLILGSQMQQPVTELASLQADLSELHQACTHQYVKNAWDDDKAQAELQEQFIKFKKELDKLKKNLLLDMQDFEDAAHYGLLYARLGLHMTQAYQQQKGQQSAYDFNDLLLLVREYLAEFPEVCEQVSQSMDLLLVDEFQDTDPVQLEIIRLLCGSQMHAGKLFFVGDIKQSIYRFRRADPELFRALRSEVPQAGQLSLTMNFRSQPAILDFVNLLFKVGMGQEYEALTTIQEQLSPVPCVEFLFPQVHLEKQNQKSPLREAEAAWIAARIKTLLADPTPRIRERSSETGKTFLRPVVAGDIVILFQALTNIQEYEQALLKQGIDYYLVGGHAFFAQQEIYDLTNLCLAIAEPDHHIALLGILRSPMFNLSDETLLLLGSGGKDLWTALSSPHQHEIEAEQLTRIHFASEVLTSLREQKDHLTLGELLELALDKTGYDACLLLEHLGSRKLANLQKLIEEAQQFSAHGLGLREFAEHLEHSLFAEVKEKFAATSPEVGNTVRMMTIHQSKGLEFPVVFVTDCNRSLPANTQTAVLHAELGPLVSLPDDFGETPKNPALVMYRHQEKRAELAQSQRSFYVALTRAKDHLILAGGISDAASPSPESWLGLVHQCFDLSTGLLRGDPLLGTMLGIDLDPARIPKVMVHHQVPTIKESPQQIREETISPATYLEQVAQATPLSFHELSRRFTQEPGKQLQLSVSSLEVLASQPQSQSYQASGKIAEQIVENESPLDFADRTELGTLIHGVLEYLPFELDDLEVLAKRILRTARWQRVDHKEELLFNAQSRLKLFIQSPFRHELINMQHQRELEFRLPWGSEILDHKLTITGTIDLLSNNHQGESWIIDYKTGRLTDDPLELLQHYGLQLGIYAQVVEQYFQQPPAKVLLVELSQRCVIHDLTKHLWSPAKLEDEITQAVTRHLESPEITDIQAEA